MAKDPTNSFQDRGEIMRAAKQHTPGPWTLPVGVISVDKVWDSTGNHEICALYGRNADADARLIATAPDMLAALRDLYAALKSDPPDGGPQKHIVGDGVVYRLDGQAMYHAINKARAAIARATGKE